MEFEACKNMIKENIGTASSGDGMFLFRSTANVAIGSVTNKNDALQQLDADAAEDIDASLAAEENVTGYRSCLEFTEAALENLSFKEHLSRFQGAILLRQLSSMKADEESVTQNAGTASSHDDVGDVNKKDALDSAEGRKEASLLCLKGTQYHTWKDAAEAVVSGVVPEQLTKATDELFVGNHSDILAMLTEASSITQAVLDRIDDDAVEMMAAAFEKTVDEVKALPFSAILKVFCRQAAVTYLLSKNTPERLELHEAKIAFFRGTGSGPDPPPISNSFLVNIGLNLSTFNPLYDELWLPWARKVQFIDQEDLGMLFCDREEAAWGLQARNLGLLISFAIPSRQVLEYMVQRAPEAKIAELGAGSGYWAALLQRLGANIVAVDNGSEEIHTECIFFPARIMQDGTEFLKSGGADGRALFLCWPRHPLENPAVLSFLENYSGNTIFFVGELGDGCTFDLQQWAYEHKDEGWEVEEMFPIPTWLGIHDVFLCISKKVTEDQSSVAGKPRS